MQLLIVTLDFVGKVIWWAAVAVALLLVVRVIIAWASSNPFMWLPYQLRRVTEPMVRPFRQPFSGYHTRFDLLPLVAAALLLMVGWFIGDMIRRLAGLMWALVQTVNYASLTGSFLAGWTIVLVGTLYEAAIFLRFLLPWFGIGYSNSFMRFLFRLTEPLLKPLRRLLGNFVSISMFDFTPLIALILVRLVTNIQAGRFRHEVEMRENPKSVTFKVRVQPRASRTELAGEYGDAIKIRVAAAPVDGKANDECRRFIAGLLGVAPSAVEIASGSTSRDKVIRVYDINDARLRELLGRNQ